MDTVTSTKPKQTQHSKNMVHGGRDVLSSRIFAKQMVYLAVMQVSK